MTQNSNETQIRTLIENWAKGVRAQDMRRVLANHADDIVMFDVPMPLQSKGIEEYKKTWELFFDHNSGGPGSFDVTDLRIFASEFVSYCHAFVNIFNSKVRLTIGLRKEKGQWLVAHEHHSYPVELTSRQ
jgi:ketosteroid isomerase-like protein